MTGDRGFVLLPRKSNLAVNAHLPRMVEKLPANQSGASTRFIDPDSSGDEWDLMVEGHPTAHVFHSAAWARVLTRTYSHRPFYVAATNGIRTAALVPSMEVRSPLTGARGVALPFSDFCQPLHLDRTSEDCAINALVETGRARKWKSLTVRGISNNLTTDTPSFYGHALHLGGNEEELFQGFTSSVRRAIRKAEKSDLKIEVSTAPGAMEEFFRLHCLTRRRHGLPPQPWNFFSHIQQEMISPGGGFVVLARQRIKAVAAAVFLRWKDKALYKFGASDTSAQEFRANNLIIWDAIKFCLRLGVNSLHFGRTDVGQAGLRRFKLSWGSEEMPIHYRCFDFRRGHWTVVGPHPPGFSNRIFRHMPLPFNRLAGSLIYPHLD